MDDATQKLGTCRTCRHAEHEGYICLNMASDSDCGCDKRPPKVVADATQKLVDETEAEVRRVMTPIIGWPRIDAWLAARDKAVLEAAQRPPALDAHALATDAMTGLAPGAPVDPEIVRELLIGAIEHAVSQRPPVAEPSWCTDPSCLAPAFGGAPAKHWHEGARPPVSPEAREEVARVIFNHNAVNLGSAVRFGAASERMKRSAYEYADALLARFSVPSQPVYDEEAIARFLAELPSGYVTDDGQEVPILSGLPAWDPPIPEYIAAALVAALRGGELTREESNRG